MVLALDASIPETERSSPEAIRGDVEARREYLEPMLRQMAIIGFLYTYRDFSADEVDVYIAFAETDAGRWYADAMAAAFLESVTSASRIEATASPTE